MLSLLLLPFRVPSQHSCFPNGLPHSATLQAKTPRQGRGWQEPAWSLSAEKGQSQQKTGPKEMEQVPGLGPEPQAKTRILRKMGVICRSERGREGGGEAGRAEPFICPPPKRRPAGEQKAISKSSGSLLGGRQDLESPWGREAQLGRGPGSGPGSFFPWWGHLLRFLGSPRSPPHREGLCVYKTAALTPTSAELGQSQREAGSLGPWALQSQRSQGRNLEVTVPPSPLWPHQSQTFP